MSIDFSTILPPLTPEQYETLKASIAANGVVDPVLIWEKTGEVFDGFHWEAGLDTAGLCVCGGL